MPRASSKTKSTNAVEEFLALPDEEKERIWESLNREIPESETTPLSKKEQAEWESFLKKARSKRSAGSNGHGARQKPARRR